ncbi:uncharacterized protein LOC126908406 isoform X2 [Daktulosphaira vitifoliae]|uniref:uncharacterized protein LOC126908406 isoform X2 n=1 Tax=Daktulosphaira vitifoliae TaxID=58002 RepID=UPI0021A9B1EC|nr:uncharacterized protein LOC126908406 isoform X2 [Daktulosphaira vitifoliae]
MLDVLREANKYLYSTELMSINLYLNNVSEYVQFYARNNDGIYNISDQTSSILKGYMIFHDYFSDQFENILLSKWCQSVIYDESFIYCPDYNESGEYTPENFQYVAKKLKNRLLQIDKELNENDDNFINLKFSSVYNIFQKAFKRSKYWEFLPKNIVFYDFMMSNRKIPEIDIIISSQDKQYPMLINGRKKYVLDMIRFARLSITCPGNSRLTLFDIFRFVKYTCYRKEIRIFHTLILTATFRPIALLLRLFTLTLSSSTYVYDFDSDQEESSKFYENIISVGKIIIECFQNFVNMNLFGDGPTNFFFTLSKKTSTCLSHFIHKNKTDLTLSSIDFKNSLESFFYNNKIEMYVLNAYFEKNFIDDCFNKLVVNLQEVQEYLTELEKHKKLFEVTKNTFNITHILNVEHTFIFNTRIIEELCQNEDIYTFLYKLNDNKVTRIGDIKEKSIADNDENISKNNMRHNNQIKKYISKIYLFPKYLIDYILYIRL